MTADLFKTKKEQILDFIKQRKGAKTSDVIKFGLSIYTNRGDRYARQLAQEKHLRRMTDEEKYYHYGRIKEKAWIAI